MEDDASLTTGSCTERHWDEPACFHTCFGGECYFPAMIMLHIRYPPSKLCHDESLTYGLTALGDDLSAPSTVYRCDGDFWCCSPGNNATSCCATASNKFALKQGSRALIQNGTSFNKGYTLVSIVEPTTASSTPPASAQPAAATSTDPSKSASSQISTGTASVTTGDINNEKLKVGLGAGLGVGLPLLVALLASLFLLASEKKVNRGLREGMRPRELEFHEPTNLPPTKQYYPQPYPELSAQGTAVSELPSNRGGIPA